MRTDEGTAPGSRPVAVVTGGAGGIGAATVTAFADQGYDVVVVDADEPGAKDAAAVAEGRGARAVPVALDLASVEAIRSTMPDALAPFGRVDALVNNAGTGTREPFAELAPETWDRVHHVNLRATFFMIQTVAPYMIARKEGAIVNVSSSAGFRATMTNPAYSSSKAGVDALTRSLAAELGAHGINVNAVAPGLTATKMGARLGSDDDMNAAVRSGPLANLLARVARPEDVASVIVFLCSTGARQITGQTIHTSAGNIV